MSESQFHLEMSSDLSKEDLDQKAKLLGELGTAGDTAIELMRKLAEAVSSIEEASVVCQFIAKEGTTFHVEYGISLLVNPGMFEETVEEDPARSMTIGELGLSVRAQRLLLHQTQIKTLGELVDTLSTDDLHNLQNCGRLTAQEIIDAVERHGLALRGNVAANKK